MLPTGLIVCVHVCVFTRRPFSLLLLVLAAILLLCWGTAQVNGSNAPATRVRKVYRVAASTASSQQPRNPALAGPECICLGASHTGSSSRMQHELVVPDVRSRTEDILPDVARQVMELEKQGKAGRSSPWLSMATAAATPLAR